MGGDIPVNTTDQDGGESTSNTTNKKTEFAVLPESDSCRIGLGAFQVFAQAKVVIRAQDAEAKEHDDLQDDTRNDGTVAAVEKGLVVTLGGRGNTASDGLDNETREIGGEEDARVPLRCKAGDLRVEVEGDVLEGQVDGDADEGRAKDNGADLHLESVLVPGVIVHHSTADVA